MLDPDEVIADAGVHGWTLIDHQEAIGLLLFRRGVNKAREQINVYYTTGTIGTSLLHPKYGRTQLFRRRVTEAQLQKLLATPRAHTGKGYYTRKI